MNTIVEMRNELRHMKEGQAKVVQDILDQAMEALDRVWREHMEAAFCGEKTEIVKKTQFNTRVLPDTKEKATKLAAQHGVSQGSIVDRAIEQLGNTPLFRRDRACVRLCVTRDRDQFIAWCIANDVPEFAALDEWEGFLEEFDTGGDAADLDATLKGAMEVLA